MAFTVLQILTSLSLLSLINAIPYDQAHYEQQEDIDLPDTSHSSPNLAKAKGKATESSNFPTIVRPTPFNSRVLGYSGASTDATPPKGPQQEPYGTGPYSGPQQSIPHHSSSIAGPTASYGTATSSGNDYSFPQQPINGSSDGLSRPSNCSSASFITVPPITVTVTSTVSANPGPLPAIIPTVTRTITTTVCLASGQHTDLGGSGDSSLPETSTVNSYSSVSHGAVNLDQGYGQANRSLGIQEPYVSYQNSATIASDEGQVPTNTQMMPNLSTSQGGGPNVPSGSNLDQGGSRDVSLGNTTTPPYGFNNDTSSETGSETGSYVLETKTGVTSAPAMPEPLPQYDRGGNDISSTVPYTVSNVVPPIATGAGSFATPALINSATSVPGTEVSYQPPSGTGPAAPGNGATDYIGSDPCGNGGCKNLQEYCDAVRRNGQSDPKCNPELPPSPTTPGNGGIDYIGSDPCGNGGCKSLQEYCSAVRRNGQSDSKCDSELSPPLTTSLPLYQPPSDTGVVYTTMTQEVVPYPIEPAPDNVPSPSISQPQILSPGVLVPNTSSSTTSEELLPTPAPSFPTTALADKPIPPPSSPPSPSGVNSTTTDPPCIPSTENKLITVDFNLLPPGAPLPSPYEFLLYTGFELSASSASSSSYLIAAAPASAVAKSIAIAPPAKHFNLTSLSLACSAPPCNITIWGTKVASKTASGGAAGSLLTSKTRVEAKADGEAAFTVVDGLDGKGWTDMEKISFVVEGEGVGIAVDDLKYEVRIEGGCEGEDGKLEVGEEGNEVEKGPEGIGNKVAGLGKGHRRRIRKM